jgi:hypothetical protein
MQWKSPYAFINLFFVPLLVADLPLSAVGDTLTLPYTSVYALFSQRLSPPPHGIQGGGRFDGVEPKVSPSPEAGR